jgi:hypothetical protein
VTRITMIRYHIYLQVIVYFRGPVSKPLYAAVAVAVVSLCVLPSLGHVQSTCQSHATWVGKIRKVCFLLQSAEKNHHHQLGSNGDK